MHILFSVSTFASMLRIFANIPQAPVWAPRFIRIERLFSNIGKASKALVSVMTETAAEWQAADYVSMYMPQQQPMGMLLSLQRS